MSQPHSQRGAALLMAMLTAALVATIAATASWRIWQISEVEAAEQDRAQMQWVLQGALDWARLLLREDARANQREKVDHLNEPWALPLEEARLSTFLAAKDQASAHADINDAFLSGWVIDAQSRFNLTNLWDDKGEISPADVAAFVRLCELLQTPAQPWLAALERLTPTDAKADRPVPPQDLRDWARAGVPLPLIESLHTQLTVLPKRTPVNVNTASASVLAATMVNGALADATQWVRERNLSPYRSISDWQNRHPDAKPTQLQHIATSSDFFEVTGQLRIGAHSVIETSLLQRDNLNVHVVWRRRQTAAVRVHVGVTSAE